MWNLFPIVWPILRTRHSFTGKRLKTVRPGARPCLENLEARLNPAFVYGVDNDWGSGFQAHGLLTNDQPAQMSNWKVEFDYNRDINSIWDGKIASRVGHHYVITPAAYNATIAVGASIQFGFLGAGGATSDKPTQVVISWDGSSQAPVLPSVSVSDTSVTEGNSGTRNALFTVALSAKSATTVTVAFATANSTASAGSDYQATTGTVSFAPGETSKTVAVPVNGDTAVELDEQFTLALRAPSGATLARATATATIINDDVSVPVLPTLSVADATVLEGDSGTKTVSLTVKLSAASSSSVIVAYATADGTARAGSDYVASAGSLTFAPGETSKVVALLVNGDKEVELDELFSLVLSSPVGATIARAKAGITIQSDDAGPVQPGELTARGDLSIVADWGAGFTATVTVSNTGTKAIEGWKLAYDFPFAVSNIWNAKVASQVGNRFTLVDVGYNATIQPGGSISFGFNGSPGSVSAGPTNWTLNGVAISGSFNGANPANPPPATPATPPTISIADTSIQVGVPGNGVAPGYFKTMGNQIVDASGQVVRLAGVNWFGMEGTNFAPHGLWSRGYKEMMDQMKQTGFNTIRLPISNQLFDAGSLPNGIDFSKNADLRGLNGLQVLDKIVAYAGQIGLRIFLDHHRSDAGAGTEGSGLWYTAAYPESRFIADWKMLATHYANNPTVIGADLHNEPHGVATWGSGVAATDWRLAAQKAGNAILAANPDWLILVEGIESGSSGNYWWGGNLSNAGAYPVQLDVANRLVYSTHDYPASVFPQTWFSGTNYPDNLPSVWDKNWGYLYKNGIAPVLVGEFGSKLETASDKLWLEALVKYMGGGITGGTLPVGQQGPSWTYWSWNPNSGDTGGILADDWKTVNQAKLDLIQPIQFAFNASTDGKVVTTFEVTLSQASSKTVTVNFTTLDGTAKAGKNYTATSGTLSFAPGETRKTIPVTILPDATMTADLLFTLQLSTPIDGVLASVKQGTGTIRKR